MKITKETKLKDLLAAYPWLKEEAVKINKKLSILNTGLGQRLIGELDIAALSQKSGKDIQSIITKIEQMIDNHGQP